MHTLKNRLIAAACGAVVIAAFLLLVPHRSEAQYASPIRVTNTTAQSIPVVLGPGGTPFSLSRNFYINQGASVGIDPVNFPGNPTHALVIDQVSWDGNVSTGQLLVAEIGCFTGGNQVFYSFQVPSFGANPFETGQDRMVGTVSLHVYCDVNTPVLVHVERNSKTDAVNFPYFQSYVLSGYLLP